MTAREWHGQYTQFLWCFGWGHQNKILFEIIVSLIKNLTSEHFCCAWPQRQRLPRAANKQRPWSKTKQFRGKTSVLKLYCQWLSPFNGPAFDYCLNLTLTDSLHCLLSSCHLIGLLKMLKLVLVLVKVFLILWQKAKHSHFIISCRFKSFSQFGDRLYLFGHSLISIWFWLIVLPKAFTFT